MHESVNCYAGRQYLFVKPLASAALVGLRYPRPKEALLS
jgi:hypothetical protein